MFVAKKLGGYFALVQWQQTPILLRKITNRECVMLKSFYLIIFFASLLCLLTGCGFKLQGNEPLPHDLKILAIDSDTPYDSFIQQLASSFKQRHVLVIKNVTDAPYVLHVTNLNLSTTQTSVGTSQQIRQYQVTYSASFSLVNHAGEAIMPSLTLSASQNQTMLGGQLLQNTSQLNDLKTTLERQVINQLFDHFEAMHTMQMTQVKTKQKIPSS